MTVFLIKKEVWIQTQIGTRGRQCEDGKVTTEAQTGLMQAMSQATPRIAGHHQELGRGEGGFYPRFQRQHGSANNLILDI